MCQMQGGEPVVHTIRLSLLFGDPQLRFEEIVIVVFPTVSLERATFLQEQYSVYTRDVQRVPFPRNVLLLLLLEV